MSTNLARRRLRAHPALGRALGRRAVPGYPLVLDLCGAVVAGSRTEAAQTVATYALYAHGNGSSTIMGTGANSTPVGAALANGFAASALDIDDGYRPVKGHPGG